MRDRVLSWWGLGSVTTTWVFAGMLGVVLMCGVGYADVDIFDWWEVYDAQAVEPVALFGVRLGQDGSYFAYKNGGVDMQERGTYVVSGRSEDAVEITVTVTETDDVSRAGLSFVSILSFRPRDAGDRDAVSNIEFSNAPVLTAGYWEKDTILLGRAVSGGATAATWGSWGTIKRRHFRQVVDE